MRSFLGMLGLTTVATIMLSGCNIVPSYNVYEKRMNGIAALQEAQSSRQISVLEARAKRESAFELSQAEVIRAQGAAQANHILQNSMGGPDNYLRYLQIQALEDTKAQLVYVPTEAGLPITEARHKFQ